MANPARRSRCCSPACCRAGGQPPVEELLLAQAHLDLNQRDEALRFYRAATEWLDQPGRPIQAVNIVALGAQNLWAGLGAAFAPVEDPRRNPFD